MWDLLKEVEGLYYLCSKNKGADLHFCFGICRSRFSHEAAQIEQVF